MLSPIDSFSGSQNPTLPTSAIEGCDVKMQPCLGLEFGLEFLRLLWHSWLAGWHHRLTKFVPGTISGQRRQTSHDADPIVDADASERPLATVDSSSL